MRRTRARGSLRLLALLTPLLGGAACDARHGPRGAPSFSSATTSEKAPPLDRGVSPAAAGDASGAVDCAASLARLQARLRDAARCETDGDCSVMTPGCPFGCAQAVHRKTDLDVLGAEIAAYKAACNRCLYRCRPSATAPHCEAGWCTLR